MYQIAVYGKGGIGKSTMSANISAALAARGRKVLQVGCDPKHDSTRLLIGGNQRTVLEYIRDVPAPDRRIDDIIAEGAFGVLCAEAGGPEPGIGCAGRGILTTFDILKKLGADRIHTDYRIYDVLGDVVCGGFAVPLRSEYADGILLVTSGEFMSIYAANNIMKGMLNFDTGSPRLIGIILNSRGVEGEEETVRRFAEATGTEVIAVMPRDKLFADAEAACHTVRELYPDSEISKKIDAIADRIEAVCGGTAKTTDPKPLNDEQMSDLAAGRPIREGSVGDTVRLGCGGCGRGRSIKETRVMHSCAAYGAAAAFLKMNDVAVVIHGPRSCAFLMDSSRSKAVLDMYGTGIFDTDPARNLRCTEMDDASSIFGGLPELERCLRSTVAEGFSDIAVVTTCMPGITGDDCMTVIDRISEENPDVRIRYVPADGDVAGDYTDGFMLGARRVADMIDISVEPQPGYVNLIGTSFFDVHSREQNDNLKHVLALFDLKENCRFMDETTSENVRMYMRAPFDIMMSNTMTSKELSSILRERTGRSPIASALPVGPREYADWLRTIGTLTGKPDVAEKEIRESERLYDEFIASRRPRFEGKRMLISTKLSFNIDWLIDMLDDLGADIVRIGFARSSRKDGSKAVSEHADRIVEDYCDDMLVEDLAKFDPDLVICDISRGENRRYARLSKVGIGVRPVLRYAEYLENMMRLPPVEGWRSRP